MKIIDRNKASYRFEALQASINPRSFFQFASGPAALIQEKAKGRVVLEMSIPNIREDIGNIFI